MLQNKTMSWKRQEAFLMSNTSTIAISICPRKALVFQFFTASVAALFLLTLVSLSEASQFGRNGFSGDPGVNGGSYCIVCHAPASGQSDPTIVISGPRTVDAGSTNSYTVTISGGPGLSGGAAISVEKNAGTLAAVNSDLQVVGDELSHSMPKNFSGGSLSFSFEWTAPSYNADIELYAAGLSSDNMLSLTGDRANTTTLLVDIVNGTGTEPTDPPTPGPAAIFLRELVSGLERPVVIANAGDERLFVVEQPGRIRIIDGSETLLTEPFLDIAGQVNDGPSEMGLLGLAFHPNYAVNGYFYVYYTPSGPRRTRVSRFQASIDHANLADTASELVLMEFSQPFSNHNAGDMHFGPEGYLYIASGDGGSGGDPQNLAQNQASPLGKILRIDVDMTSGGTAPDCDTSGSTQYLNPPDNAFGDGPGGNCDETYASGLRNPWRFSFDRLTDDMWIADVGQGRREEINYVPAGTAAGINFGWRCYEGNRNFNLNGCSGGYFFPAHDIDHNDDNDCSITGGFVYRGSKYPQLRGRYFFTDFCNTAIRTVSGTPGSTVISEALPAGNIVTPSTFGEDNTGELYVASLNQGTIYAIESTPPARVPAAGTWALAGATILLLIRAGYGILSMKR
jgi:glucose/arabinose dehydrogenase